MRPEASELKKYGLLICILVAVRFHVGTLSSIGSPIIPTLIIQYENDTRSISNITSDTRLYEKLSILYFVDKIIYTLMTPICGITLEHINSRLLLIMGTISQMISLLWFGLSYGYYHLIIAKSFDAISMCLLNTSVDSLNSELFKNYKLRGLLTSLSKLSFNISISISPLFGGFLYQYFGKIGAFLPYVCLILPTLVMTIVSTTKYYIEKSKTIIIQVNNPSDEISKSCFKIDEKEEKVTVTSIINKDKPKLKLKHLLFFTKDPLFLIMICSMPVCAIPKVIQYITIPHYMSLRFQASNSKQGSVWSLGILGTFVGFFLGTYLNSSFSRNRHVILFMNQLVQAACIISIPLIPVWWLISIPLCIYMITQMVYSPIAYALLASIVEKRHNKMFGLMSGFMHFTLGISLTISVFFGPMLMKHFGYFMLNFILFLMNFFYGFLFLYLKDYIMHTL